MRVSVRLVALLASAAFVFARSPAPDLQGTWSNSILTPLERPKAFAEQALFTEQQARDFERPDQIYERWKAPREADVDAKISTEIVSPYADSGNRHVGADRRTSLIVDPPNGRLPPRSADALARAALFFTGRTYRPPDNPEELLPNERCLTWGAGPPMLPLPYNNNIQIVQTPGAVVIAHESMHEYRIVPLDGRPHLPPSIRQWSGDPRGRWDGATLVVDTTNFTGKTSVEGSGARLHVVERFTRTAADALRYEFTIEDPAFARPWSAAWTLTRTAERVFEYACHEGNYSMPMTLAGARAQEREAVAVRVLMSGGFSAAFHALRPELERTADVAITIATGASQGDGPNTIGAQLRRGDAADVVILSREGLDDLIDDGRIARGSDANLAATPLGVAVRAGAPKPDLSSVDAFKQMLLRAGAIAFANSTTGMYLTTKLFPRLGIADEMARKSTTAGVAAVAQGRADVAIQPVSELLHAPGVDFVGPLPREVQYISVFSAAIVAGARHADAGARVIAFLTSPAAAAAIKTSGMDPARR